MIYLLIYTLNLSVFFCSDKNKVVNITHFNFEMILQTIKHTIIYPGSGLFSEVIALRLAL
jgi:hypothetical protein